MTENWRSRCIATSNAMDSMAQQLVFAIEAMQKHKGELESRIGMLKRILSSHKEHILPSILMQLERETLGPREPNDDLVICPNCTCQFRAVPVNVQKVLSERCI